MTKTKEQQRRLRNGFDSSFCSVFIVVLFSFISFYKQATEGQQVPGSEAVRMTKMTKWSDQYLDHYSCPLQLHSELFLC